MTAREAPLTGEPRAVDDAHYRTVEIDPLDHCPTHAVCPPCREGWGHWDGHQYVPTLESEA